MFRKNNAEQSRDSNAETFPLRFVTTSPVRFQGKIVRMCQLRSATQNNKPRRRGRLRLRTDAV